MWNHYLYDIGISPVEEPYKKLVHQGMILGSNGVKMGKRFPEYVINPTDIVNEYGADTLRLYEMFMGPLEASKPWSNDGVVAANKFIDRIYRFISNKDNITNENDDSLTKVYNYTVKKITNDYESLSFNTAVSQMMIFMNECYKVGKISYEYACGFVKLINPMIPHVAEELWNILGHDNTIAFEPWPEYDESKLTESTKTIAVQVNGKLRGTIEANVDSNEEELKEKALENENVKKYTEGKEILKVIVIKDKIVSIVIK